MSRLYDERLQTQTFDWAQQFDAYFTHACTFTFKQYVGNNEVTAEMAWDNWDSYCKYINRRLYGHASKRHGKSLLIFPVLHGELKGKRLHFHAAIGCVDRNVAYEDLAALINKTWREMKWTLNEVHAQPYRDSRWIGYTLKESTRLDLHSVDITRCCIPPSLSV